MRAPVLISDILNYLELKVVNKKLFRKRNIGNKENVGRIKVGLNC